MKKSGLMAFIAAVMLLSGCGGENRQTPDSAGEDSSTVYVNAEKTVFGICGEGSAMNTLQMITDSGDTLSLSITDAKENGKVLGGYACGDRMAVLLNDDKTVAQLVINETTLLGNWVMPNPLDGSSFVGISLKDGGRY